MTSRSNWEYKSTPANTQVAGNALDSLPPGMRAEAEARAAAKANRPVNEAITVKESAPEPKTAPSSDRAKGRGQYVNDIVDKASK